MLLHSIPTAPSQMQRFYANTGMPTILQSWFVSHTQLQTAMMILKGKTFLYALCVRKHNNTCQREIYVIKEAEPNKF